MGYKTFMDFMKIFFGLQFLNWFENQKLEEDLHLADDEEIMMWRHYLLKLL